MLVHQAWLIVQYVNVALAAPDNSNLIPFCVVRWGEHMKTPFTTEY